MALEQATAAPQDSRVVPALRRKVVPLSSAPPTYDAAVERYLTGAGIAKSSARIYRIAFTTWGWPLRGQQAPRPSSYTTSPGIVRAPG